MTLHYLTPSHEWDSPIFKVLANNDTGSAKGHQGGVVIPKEIRSFFPGLVGTTSSSNPTIDYRIEAQLFVDNKYKGTVNTRYQFQTWGGARSPESRLTDQLGPLRNLASCDDVLIIQRSIDRINSYKLSLVTKNSAEFPKLVELIGNRRWGVLSTAKPPVSIPDLDSAFKENVNLIATPFTLIDTVADTTISTVKKLARSIVFRVTVLEQYEESCAVCGESLKTPSGLVEIDAAHVVPRSLMGADDVRNGLALCKRHHWAFDKGLFGISAERRVFVPQVVSSIMENVTLANFHDRPIREAKDSALKVDQSAFKWHRDNIMIK